jgi:hypothetical protein
MGNLRSGSPSATTATQQTLVVTQIPAITVTQQTSTMKQPMGRGGENINNMTGRGGGGNMTKKACLSAQTMSSTATEMTIG